MTISKVYVRKYNNNLTRGFANLTLTDDNGDTIYLKNITIMMKKDKSNLFISFPTTKPYVDAKTQKMVYPEIYGVNPELKKRIHEEVMAKYLSMATESDELPDNGKVSFEAPPEKAPREKKPVPVPDTEDDLPF
jgi:DNA-binding cell septation regulator SpoVG